MSPEGRFALILAGAWCVTCFALVGIAVWKELRIERRRRGR